MRNMRIGLVKAALWLAALLSLNGCSVELPAWRLPWQTAPTHDLAPSPANPEDDRSMVSILAPAGDGAEGSHLQTLLDHFQQTNPDIAVAATLVPDYDAALTVALTANPPPDLVVLDGPRGAELAPTGALAPLDPVIEAVDDIHPLLRTLFSFEGRLFCAPREVRTLALVYNRALFDKAELAYPTADWTWDDLRAAAETLTDRETATVGLALPPDFSRWLPFLYQAGGSVTDDAMTVMAINSTEASTAMSFYVDLVIDGFAAAPSDLESVWAGEAVGRGRAAMAIEGNWIVPFLKGNGQELNFGVSELPSGPQGRATLAFTTCYAIPANAPNPAAAQRLVRFLTSSESLTMFAETGYTMPPRLSLHEHWRQEHPELEAFLNGLAYARPWRLGVRFLPLFSTVNTGLQQAFLSVRSVADILAEADGVGNRALAR